MLYRNRKTGMTVDTRTEVCGEDWEPVNEPNKEPKEKKRAKRSGE